MYKKIIFSIFIIFMYDAIVYAEDLKYFYLNPFKPSESHGSVVLKNSELYYSEYTPTLLLGQVEPVLFTLQNSSNKNIRVIGINVDETVDDADINYNFRVVKKWYMGSNSSIHPTMYDLQHPILSSELLLKNDDLVRVDKKSKKNYVLIRESGISYYQDISSPTSLMPNNAIIDDANELQPFFINAKHDKQIWLNIKTSELTKPGSYNKKIIVDYLANGRKKFLVVPLTFYVLPVILQNDELTRAIYYAGKIKDVNNKILSIPKSEVQYKAELKNLKDHNLLYPTQYLLDSDESMIEKYLTIRSDLGFPCDKIFFIGGIGNANVKHELILKNNINKLKNYVRNIDSCKNARIYLYGQDEAVGNKLSVQKSLWNYVIDSGAYVFAASNSDEILENNMMDELDVMITSNDKPNAVDRFNMRKRNKQVYLYGRPQSGISDPFIYRKNYGYYLIKNDYTGSMPFAYQFGFPECYRVGDLSGGLCFNSESSYCSVWNNFDSLRYYDHMFTYPTTNGVIDTIQWEGYAAAITDTRYYYTLLNLMKNNCTSNDLRCEFNPESLINIDDPNQTRLNIVNKIKVLITFVEG